MVDPYVTPKAELDSVSLAEAKRFGGIGRLLYFAVLVAIILVPALIARFGGQDIFLVNGAFGFVKWVLYAGVFIATYLRFKNIGMMPWLALLIFIPLINLFVVVRGMIFQEGYTESGKLDSSGRIITFVIFGVLGLFAIAAVISIVRL